MLSIVLSLGCNGGDMTKRVLTGAGVLLLLAGTVFAQAGSELAAIPLTIAADKLPELSDAADIQLSKVLRPMDLEPNFFRAAGSNSAPCR